MDKKIDKLFVATKAFIVRDDEVLVMEESREKDTGTHPGKFDFPGGKLEPGENPEDCLKREVQEEINLDIKILKPFHVLEWQPIVHGEQWQVVGIYYECKLVGEVDFKLSHEHDSFKWIKIEDYESHNLMKEPREAFKKYLELQK